MELDDLADTLTYKGVVFNEMKGAMSSPVSTLWQTLTREVYPIVPIGAASIATVISAHIFCHGLVVIRAF